MVKTKGTKTRTKRRNINRNRNRKGKNNYKPTPKSLYVSEEQIYKERNGQVLENSNIVEEVNNNKLKIYGYKNGKRINYTRKL